MLSVWVESRSSPNLAQVGGRVWGYAGCEGQQEHHLYTCTNFNLNRDAALAEWRQRLSALISIAPISLVLVLLRLPAP